MATLGFNCFVLFYFSVLSLFSIYSYVIKNAVFMDRLTANLNLKDSTPKKFFVNFLDLLPLQIVSFWIFFFNAGGSRAFLVFIFLFIVCIFLTQYCLNGNFLTGIYDAVLPLSLPIFIFFLLKANTYIHFLFFVELIGYSFYFQFVSTTSTKTLTRLLDLYLFYYWSSFVGTILLFLVSYRLLLLFNTTSFSELFFFFNFRDFFISFFFTIGLLVKMGAAGVHFLKADFYKYISVISILNFSVLSSFIYILIYNFFLTFGIACFIFSPLIILLLVSGLLLFVFNIKHINNLALFFGYSGVLTISIALLVLI